MLVSPDNFELAIRELESSPLLAVDTETTGLNVHNKVDYLMGICISNGTTKLYFPFRHKDANLERHHLVRLIETIRSRNLIWHNRKFDMHSLRTIGVDPLGLTGIQYDTLLISHLINEELYSQELDPLCQRYIGRGKSGKDEVEEYAKIFGRQNIPADLMATYGAEDAQITYELFQVLWPMLEDQELDKVYLVTEMPFTEILYSMEQQGVGVNREFTEQKVIRGRGRMESIKRQLHFNPASPIDLGKVLLGDLGLPVFAHTQSCEECKRHQPVSNHSGKPSFNKNAMREYDEILQVMNNPTARLISEYRGWQKAVTSLYEPLLERTGPDGRIRTNFKQHGTVTGRLSAESPNLQQVPRNSSNPWNGDAKSAFTSGREGFSLIGWDERQLELRLAASYGNESLLLEEFEKPDADPFSTLAPLIFGYLDELVRQDTKTFVYANLYGAGLAKIAFQLGRSVDEVDGLYKRYKSSIPGIMQVSSKVTRLVEQRKYVKYWDGRRRHIRNRRDAYKAWNSVCQGGGAQLIKQAMIKCREFTDDNCQMVLQVHDEITFIIKTELIPTYEPLIVEAMTNFDLGVKFAVEGKAWK